MGSVTAFVLSTNLAHPRTDPGGADRVSGIDKRPAPSLEVFAPGPSYGDGPGVVGDTVGDSAHHGGAQKAVYAFAREELDHWERELGRTLPNGSFGENLTTRGVDLSRLLINQRIRIGTAELEVSVSRTPCRTFAGWLDEAGWVKRFSARERTGAYFRVVVPGTITAGDELVLVDAPGHDVDMLTVFRGALGDKEAARRIVEARCLPQMYHERMVRLTG
ncbi:hypothetical protein A605_13845 [Corynebacterium halotolerans YIM 70093 = DSM 44683]|uniref:MOSC domain-containing protein n=1 Tax=Corynebacterium halotolerans YIM 70093 = DSM 44683 TaxID=1121362 RepID=M1P1S3_9CORY|nr:hypothetical protein A605_13845 [Corynebacterium halotolerans YIM 70093 = DSM 44683]